jgi:hypothetical protein
LIEGLERRTLLSAPAVPSLSAMVDPADPSHAVILTYSTPDGSHLELEEDLPADENYRVHAASLDSSPGTHTLSIGGLDPDTSSRFRLRADADGRVEYAETTIETAPDNAGATLATPTVSWTYTTGGSANLTWNWDGRDGEYGISQFQEQDAPGLPWIPMTGDVWENFPMWTDPPGTPATGSIGYSIPAGGKVRVRLSDGYSTSAWSEAAGADNSPAFNPSAVGSLSASVVPGTNDVALTWDYTPPEGLSSLSFLVRTWDDDGTGYDDRMGFLDADATIYGSATGCTLSDAAVGTHPAFAVFVGGGGPSSYDPGITSFGYGPAAVCNLTGGTPASPTPAAPGNLSATLAVGGVGPEARLLWDNTPNNETGYEVQRRVAGGSYAALTSAAADGSAVVDDTIEPLNGTGPNAIKLSHFRLVFQSHP